MSDSREREFQDRADQADALRADPVEMRPRGAALAAGVRLGPYEIRGAAGSGGMGEVYRARDTRLDRTVAIKVLPRHLARSPERRRRLEREARVVSQLNHPNICTLYDIGHENDVDFLVMELIEGETLAARLDRGPLPLDRALETAIQIAGALDAAHRRGATHRDLKPANIMLTRSGAKLLDFGIARLDDAEAARDGHSTKAPRIRSPLTGEGQIPGTLRYMSPEQLEGREANARSDIWALGLVVYEMVTGRRAFEATSDASLIAAILGSEPEPIAGLKSDAPEALDWLVQTCLAKDPEERWQSASDLQHALTWIRNSGVATGGASEPRRRSTGERWAWASVVLALVISLALLVLVPGRPDDVERPARFRIGLPDGVIVFSSRISPDGRYLSFSAVSDGPIQIWLRPMDELTARPIAGTDGARWFHEWSPDSRSIVFFAEGKLKRVDIRGGPPQVLSDAPGSGPLQSAAWSSEGTLLFDVLEVPGTDGLYRLDGPGQATRLTIVDENGEELHPLWPSFLPDGEHFLFLALEIGGERDFVPSGIHVASLRTGRAERVSSTPSYATYSDPGYLLFVHDGALLAQPFDPGTRRLRGEPRPIGANVDMLAGAGVPSFSVSKNGLLSFTGGDDAPSHLVWKDREGQSLGRVGEPAFYGGFRLAPNEQELVVTIYDLTGKSDLWIVELGRGIATRFTSNALGAIFPTWSPDGTRVAFSMPRGAPPFMHVKPRAGGDAAVLLPSTGTNQWPWDWSPDGQFLVYGDRSPETNWDIWMLPLGGDEKPRPVLRTSFRERDARLAPDGRWMAFISDESGDFEVYVQAFPGPGERRRISTAGGFSPVWRGDGQELFYVSGDEEIMAVPVTVGESLEAGTPVVLFPVAGLVSYDVTADGQRFLINADEGESEPATVLVIDWAAGLSP